MKKIRETYEQLYNKSLIADLASEFSGDLRTALILWTYDPPERDALLAKEALRMKRRSGIRHLYPIVEIVCASSSPHHLIAVREAYYSLCNCSLEEDIVTAISLPLIGKIIAGLITSHGDDKELDSTDVANSDVAMLREAIEKKQLDDDDDGHVVRILGTRNIFQLRATFECYKQKHGNSIGEDMMNCGQGDLGRLLRMIVCCLESPERHFAEVIRNSIMGFGTDEDSLTQAIVTRAQVDLVNIRGKYFDMYKTSMDVAVVDDTSGGYMMFLMTLLGARVRVSSDLI